MLNDDGFKKLACIVWCVRILVALVQFVWNKTRPLKGHPYWFLHSTHKCEWVAEWSQWPEPSSSPGKHYCFCRISANNTKHPVSFSSSSSSFVFSKTNEKPLVYWPTCTFVYLYMTFKGTTSILLNYSAGWFAVRSGCLCNLLLQ